ncbi:MAG: hypothetical protein JST22_02220 [Bacteroidetes bacterium]|nr:hypothetical protein [Bacteroidota bacterium]
MIAFDEADNMYVGIVDRPETGDSPIRIKAVAAGTVAEDERILSVYHPLLCGARFKDGSVIDNGTDRWPALRGVIGQVYDPSTQLYTPYIADADYQTVVTFKGAEVLNRAGTMFTPSDPHGRSPLTITSDLRPEDVVTKVYWKPGGTEERSRWVLLLCNQPGVTPQPVIPLETRRMSIEAPPVQAPAEMPSAFVLSFNATTRTCSTPPLNLSWMVDAHDSTATASIQCAECAAFQLKPQLIPLGGGRYRLSVGASDYDLLENSRTRLSDKSIELGLVMSGRSGARTHTIRLYVALPESQ